MAHTRLIQHPAHTAPGSHWADHTRPTQHQAHVRQLYARFLQQPAHTEQLTLGSHSTRLALGPLRWTSSKPHASAEPLPVHRGSPEQPLLGQLGIGHLRVSLEVSDLGLVTVKPLGSWSYGVGVGVGVGGYAINKTCPKGKRDKDQETV